MYRLTWLILKSFKCFLRMNFLVCFLKVKIQECTGLHIFWSYKILYICIAFIVLHKTFTDVTVTKCNKQKLHFLVLSCKASRQAFTSGSNPGFYFLPLIQEISGVKPKSTISYRYKVCSNSCLGRKPPKNCFRPQNSRC